jgi:tRNA dimethylallyltransferase
MKAIGVSQLAALIDGKFNKQEAIDSINLLTKRYAKRQMTWARKKMVDWEWIDPVDLRVEDILLRLAQ